MPCSDSSSSMVFSIDHDEKFISFKYAKITCGSEISGSTGLSDHLKGRNIKDILEMPYERIVKDLNLEGEERQFILYMEWDVLKSAVAEYLGCDKEFIDSERCRVTSVDYAEEGIEVALVVLPPKELPKILPCSLANRNAENGRQRTENRVD